MGKARTATGWLLVGGCLAAPLAAQERGDAAAAIAAARQGGTTIVCRHAITGDTRDARVIRYGDPSTQRLLSGGGEEQSRTLGHALRALGVELTEVVASPMDRSIVTARLMAREPTIDSIWHTNDRDYHGPNRDRRATVLATTVPSGNRLIVSHIVTMQSVLPEAEGRVEEGDCVVVRPGDGGYTVLGIVPWRRWVEAAGTG